MYRRFSLRVARASPRRVVLELMVDSIFFNHAVSGNDELLVFVPPAEILLNDRSTSDWSFKVHELMYRMDALTLLTNDRTDKAQTGRPERLLDVYL
jgi:hypothetical protein